MMHINDARVSAIGTKMHANLLALPILMARSDGAKRLTCGDGGNKNERYACYKAVCGAVLDVLEE